MNPLMFVLLNIVFTGVLSICVRRVSRLEGRWVALIGTIFSLVVSGGSALTFLSGMGPIHWQTGLVEFLLDPFAATLLPAISLSCFALVLGTPETETSRRHFCRILWIQAVSQFTLIAGNPGMLLIGEFLSVIVCYSSLHHLKIRPMLKLYLGLACGLLLFAAYNAHSAGFLFASFAKLVASSKESYGFMIPLLVALAIRIGIPPFCSHVSHALTEKSVIKVLVGILPFSGFVTLARVIEPTISSWTSIEPIAYSIPLLSGAVLCAALATQQNKLGRSTGFIFIAANLLVTVGIIDPNPVGHIGGEVMWAAILVSSTGFGLLVSSIVSRWQNIDLASFHGYYAKAPMLATAFFVTGLSIAGIPGTIDFASEDLLLHGSMGENVVDLVLVAMTISLIGFNILRIYFKVFFGARLQPQNLIDLLPRERVAVASLLLFLFVSGIAPGLIPLLHKSTGH